MRQPDRIIRMKTVLARTGLSRSEPRRVCRRLLCGCPGSCKGKFVPPGM